ncbi:aldo-keto reductase family 1 member A1 [Leptinotarsa decemlineata]|uniref:aldo-keto reductase family 1 member A1 n=1 Tax=Leptinotarsa decemlineata TaxID=7539 RepID=UPI003D30B826
MAKYQTMIGGYKIPSVGLGTGTFEKGKEEVVENAVNAALELGYRHIDTAFMYDTEEIIGRVLKRWLSSGKIKREDLFITTKLPNQGVFADKVELFLKRSLELLQLDYVDLYLIHTPIAMEFIDINTPGKPVVADHVAVWKAMEQQVDAGRAKTIGLSNFNIKQIEKVIQSSRIKPASLQIELTVCLQQPELVKFCHDNDIVVVSYSSLGSPGIGKILAQKGFDMPDGPNILGDETLKKIGAKYGKSTAQVILRFFIQKNIVVIPKSSNPTRLEENFNLFDFSLSMDDVKEIENLDKGESGRLFRLSQFIPSLKEHLDYPYPY